MGRNRGMSDDVVPRFIHFARPPTLGRAADGVYLGALILSSSLEKRKVERGRERGKLSRFPDASGLCAHIVRSAAWCRVR
jgi:hypothetical protein